MFAEVVDPAICGLVEEVRSRALGWKLSGAGGGGYLILVSERPIEPAIRIVARRLLE